MSFIFVIKFLWQPWCVSFWFYQSILWNKQASLYIVICLPDKQCRCPSLKTRRYRQDLNVVHRQSIVSCISWTCHQQEDATHVSNQRNSNQNIRSEHKGIDWLIDWLIDYWLITNNIFIFIQRVMFFLSNYRYPYILRIFSRRIFLSVNLLKSLKKTFLSTGILCKENTIIIVKSLVNMKSFFILC